MFESDDFDGVLLQFDFPDVPTENQSDDASNKQENPQEFISELDKLSVKATPGNDLESRNESLSLTSYKSCVEPIRYSVVELISTRFRDKGSVADNFKSPQHTKRKFPGPAGLLTGTLVEPNDKNIWQIELLSQDIESSQNLSRRDLFESPLWMQLLDDVKTWNLCDIDLIKTIKQQAVVGNLHPKKPQTVTAFIDSIDRSATDPLVILRDTTGKIKCTLHRDAWSTFSPYMCSECCALVLWRPTSVLTTGSPFKKHYLTIMLNNIYAIYSSAILNDDDNPLPDGYVRFSGEHFTIIKTEIRLQNLESNFALSNEEITDDNGLLDGFDGSVFTDDNF